MAVEPQRLRAVGLFAPVDDARLAALAGSVEAREVPAGTNLSTEGGGGYFFFVIERGSVAVSRDGEHLATLGPGDFFGEAAVFRTRRRTATVTTAEPSTLLVVFGADFAKLTSEVPEVKTAIDAALDARLPQ